MKQVPTNPVLKTDGELRGPDLPPAEFFGMDRWVPVVEEHYRHWRSSPQAQRMGTDLDWDFLQQTMAIENEMYLTRRFATLGPEVRQRLNQLGDTPASRQSLKFDAPGADDMAASDGKVNPNAVAAHKIQSIRSQLRVVNGGA